MVCQLCEGRDYILVQKKRRWPRLKPCPWCMKNAVDVPEADGIEPPQKQLPCIKHLLPDLKQ